LSIMFAIESFSFIAGKAVSTVPFYFQTIRLILSVRFCLELLLR
jgi:hypothetical protein